MEAVENVQLWGLHESFNEKKKKSILRIDMIWH